MMYLGRIVSVALLMTLGACNSPGRSEPDTSPSKTATGNDIASAPADAAAAKPVASLSQSSTTGNAGRQTMPRSCAAEIGVAASAQRVKVCRNVSPATHSPCNAANSCAMIEDEIARSCALFAGDGSPMKGCGPNPNSMQAAADVVRRYYTAIDAHDYATAWQQLGDHGQPGQTFFIFQNGFAATRSTRVTIGTLEPGDAGAGSTYQPVPVTVDAQLDDGTSQRFAGSYLVRRVNGVDGASPAQLRWHIDSASLHRVPVG